MASTGSWQGSVQSWVPHDPSLSLQHARAKQEGAGTSRMQAVPQEPWARCAPSSAITLPQVLLAWPLPDVSEFHSTAQTAWREARSGHDT